MAKKIDGNIVNEMDYLSHDPARCKAGDHCEGCVYESRHARCCDIPDASTECCVCEAPLEPGPEECEYGRR